MVWGVRGHPRSSETSLFDIVHFEILLLETQKYDYNYEDTHTRVTLYKIPAAVKTYTKIYQLYTTVIFTNQH